MRASFSALRLCLDLPAAMVNFELVTLLACVDMAAALSLELSVEAVARSDEVAARVLATTK